MAMARAFEVPGGVLFQPYIDLKQGGSGAPQDRRYRATCHLQAEVALEAGATLLQQ